jgi:hypothetical protein
VWASNALVKGPTASEFRVELEGTRRGSNAFPLAPLRVNEQVPQVLGHAHGFTDGMARHDQVEDLLGDLELRRGFLQSLLLFPHRPLLGVNCGWE